MTSSGKLIGKCIEWTGAKCANGYGQMKVNGRHVYAHRWAWQHKHGEIPVGMCICHRCDNPLCINTDHLFLGTQADNVQDMWIKNRAVSVKGEHHGMAVLSKEQAEEIRAQKGTCPQRILAERYGVTQQQISNIQRGHSW